MNALIASLSGVGKEATMKARASKEIPGDIAIWILIFAELFEFGLFFILYIVARAHHPDLFHSGPLLLNQNAGIANTVILLTSSFFVAKAVRAIKLGQVLQSRRWLWMTFLCGVAYCFIKLWEYHYNEVNGIGIETNLYYSVYYYLTFNHLLHVGFGLAGLLWVLLRSSLGAYSAEQHKGLEAAACYWHMVDLAWIIIFPLIYVMH